jgi:tricorn protease
MLTTTILACALSALANPVGYYRQPTMHADTIVFVSEGDLWKVPAGGGVASRLTSHPGDESSPKISPDGKQVAFVGTYEGPAEIYVMPLQGGAPKRLTFDASRANVVGWKGDRILATTQRYSTLPSTQLTMIDPANCSREIVPLAQASDGVFDDAGTTLFFTRLPFQGSHTKRYKGGTAQQLWRLTEGETEATALTVDFPGTSAAPMWWRSRVYFASDRDGTMEIWSMNADGQDLTQHTRHDWLDVKSPSLSEGRIAFQLGADIHVLDIATGVETPLHITLDSDFDQTRENWVEKPFEFLSAANPSPDGKHVVMTVRGQIFIAPRDQGRLIELTRSGGVRYRNAKFMPDGKSILALSDESGEIELWKLSPKGDDRTQLTKDATVLRWEGVPSPDGRYIAHHDKNQELRLLDTKDSTEKKIDFDAYENISGITWSADSRYLAYVSHADNLNAYIRIFDTVTGQLANATTDRFVSFSPAFSPDGDWLYFLSERTFNSTVDSPWGYNAPEPYFDKRTKIYALALRTGLRFPFAPADELFAEVDSKKETPSKDTQPKADTSSENAAAAPAEPAAPSIEFEGLASRLFEVPVSAGNLDRLSVTEKKLYFLNAAEASSELRIIEIARKDVEAKTLVADCRGYELSADRKTLLIRKRDSLHLIDAGAAAPAALEKSKVELSGWSFPIVPREEWRQMFRESWRLMRDYFYDRNMHGVDWKAMLARYEPLVDRVATRAELSDLISQMVGELSALHHFVRGGDLRSGPDNIRPGTLGGVLVRDEQAGGYRIERIYQSDPDEPARVSPLAGPLVRAQVGEVITAINNRSALSVEDPSVILRNQIGKQVLLRIKAADGSEREAITVPLSPEDDAELRYHEWEYTRRLRVESTDPELGYLHLRAMGSENIAEFAKGFYPVFNRKGLIIDVRHNRGGNIDSWILSRLLRKAWFYWQPRVGKPYWNMQYAFRGHVVVLCDERTASDGEAFAEGIKRLNIGTVIGTRTWGGEVWLSSSNFLVDGGIATASEIGVYGPEGTWLIEGHGVDPDVVVDNTPKRTFEGADAQLDAAIAYLRRKIQEQPIDVPQAPGHPDKSYSPK